MGMTITEKILAHAAGLDRTRPGELVLAAVDLSGVDDIQFLYFAQALAELGGRIHDPEKVFLIADHYIPASTIDQAEMVRQLREFGLGRRLPHFYTNDGIKHQLLIDLGLARPGTVITATDSHTNTAGSVAAFAVAIGPTEAAAVWREGRMWFRVPETIRVEVTGELPRGVYAKDITLLMLGERGANFAQYKALEFGGPTVRRMSLAERQTLCNMSTEMGAKNGIVEFDEVTLAYAQATGRPYTAFTSDPDAAYADRFHIDAARLEPLVAVPFATDNVHPVSAHKGKRVTQAFVGTCTNGNYEDLAITASILKGRRVHPRVQMIITPATRQIFNQALASGLIDIFHSAGAIVTNANCGACAGLHEGVLGKGDVRIASQNRNFRGRGGHVESEIYLASPATVAASAVAGEIADPREFLP